MNRKRPNVVVLMTHDTGRVVSPYGYDTVHTPSFERVASEGTVFENAFCTAPLCTPSRAAAFTGRYPHQNGANGLPGAKLGGWELAADEMHAARLFADAGYDSAIFGFLHETTELWNLGFTHAFGGSRRGVNWGGDLLDFHTEMTPWFASRDASKPFYLQIGCHETHRDWGKDGVQPDAEHGLWKPPYLKDLPQVRDETALLQGAIRRLDEGVDQITRTLEEQGLAQDTILVLTTDHGIDFPRAKGTLCDPGIETFLLMRYPGGGWKSAARERSMISNVDLLPTLLEAAGIDIPPNIAGRSFLPLLTGHGDYTPRTEVFAEKTYHDSYDPTRSIRTDRYKYILFFDACVFQDFRSATVPRYHYLPVDIHRTGLDELYDLQADPLEHHNLTNDPAFAEIRTDLRRRLLAWMHQTADPLLKGPIASPRYLNTVAELKQDAALAEVQAGG